MLGILLHQSLKIKSLRKRVLAANEKWSYGNYFYNEYPAIFAAIVALIVLIIIQSEIARHWPKLSDWMKLYLLSAGYMGSSILQSFLSKKEKQILEIIDKKTNVADAFTLSDSTDPKDPLPPKP